MPRTRKGSNLSVLDMEPACVLRQAADLGKVEGQQAASSRQHLCTPRPRSLWQYAAPVRKHWNLLTSHARQVAKLEKLCICAELMRHHPHHQNHSIITYHNCHLKNPATIRLITVDWALAIQPSALALAKTCINRSCTCQSSKSLRGLSSHVWSEFQVSLRSWNACASTTDRPHRTCGDVFV